MLNVTELFKIFDVYSNKKLAEIIGVKDTSISNWKKTGIPALAERKIQKIIRDRGLITQNVKGSTVSMLMPCKETFIRAMDKIVDDSEWKTLEKKWGKLTEDQKDRIMSIAYERGE